MKTMRRVTATRMMGAWVGAWARFGNPPVPPVNVHCNQLPLLHITFSVEQMRGHICFLCVYCVTLKQTSSGYLQLLADYFTMSKEYKEQLNSSVSFEGRLRLCDWTGWVPCHAEPPVLPVQQGSSLHQLGAFWMHKSQRALLLLHVGMQPK